MPGFFNSGIYFSKNFSGIRHFIMMMVPKSIYSNNFLTIP